jgi:CubicO group peptidase (beta-lactamase class C family)
MNKKKILIVVLAISLVIVLGLGSYYIYGQHQINQLQTMTFEQMLGYTTKNNSDAIITVGMIQNGEMTYKVYGENGKTLPHEEHLYEIGSITKTFTASLLCKSVSEERVSFDDSIDEYLMLDEQDDYPTIRKLVTHTAGYKEFYFESPMVSNFFGGQNSFKGISDKMLIKRIEKVKLDAADYPFSYSNFGYAALGAVLEGIYDKDYTLLMNEYILDELKLENTRISDGSGDLEGYWQWQKSDAYIPAGALISDITDMIQYTKLHMAGDVDYLNIAHEALAEVNSSSESYEKMGIYINAVGAGWMIDNENGIVWHNGATSNFNSYIGFDKETQTEVVILSNLPPDYRIPATVMGVELLNSLQK